MGDRNLTLFELHVDGPVRLGPSFGDDPGPNVDDEAAPTDAPRASRPAAATDGGGDEPSDGRGGAPVKGAIVGVVAIVALAAAARVLLGDDEAPADDDPEMADLGEDAVDADD